MVLLIIALLAWLYYLALTFYFNWQPFSMDGISGVLLIVGIISFLGAVFSYFFSDKKRLKVTVSTCIISGLLILYMIYLYVAEDVKLWGDIESLFPFLTIN